jgi:hypothetical protein
MAMRTPAARNKGWGFPNTRFWISNPKLASELARVTINPPEMEIIKAGITVTDPPNGQDRVGLKRPLEIETVLEHAESGNPTTP